MVQCAVVIGDSGLVGIYQYTQLENILILQIFTECLPGANSVLDTMDTSMQSHGLYSRGEDRQQTDIEPL